MTNEPTVEQRLERLREPFPPEAIGQLPRGNVKLDYVGHATVTDRLLSVDPHWNWEPLAFTDEGLPVFEHNAGGKPCGLWIKLTVLGVTRLGYGSVEGSKAEPVKELIGDALRNAAMRFGVALDLWSKSELESQISDTPKPEKKGPTNPAPQRTVSAPGKPPAGVNPDTGEIETPLADAPSDYVSDVQVKQLITDIGKLSKDRKDVLFIMAEEHGVALPKSSRAHLTPAEYADLLSMVEKAATVTIEDHTETEEPVNE